MLSFHFKDGELLAGFCRKEIGELQEKHYRSDLSSTRFVIIGVWFFSSNCDGRWEGRDYAGKDERRSTTVSSHSRTDDAICRAQHSDACHNRSHCGSHLPSWPGRMWSSHFPVRLSANGTHKVLFEWQT